MHPHAEMIRRFYAAFAALDGAAMQACYAPEARFRDEVFELSGAEEIGAMWRMLCEATRDKGREDWHLEVSNVHAGDDRGRAHWEAHYRFGPQRRLVHNRIDAEFTIRDGLIVTHGDRFNFWSWSRQALGAPGWLLGWSPMLRGKVRAQAMAGLERWRLAQSHNKDTNPR